MYHNNCFKIVKLRNIIKDVEACPLKFNVTFYTREFKRLSLYILHLTRLGKQFLANKFYCTL